MENYDHRRNYLISVIWNVKECSVVYFEAETETESKYILRLCYSWMSGERKLDFKILSSENKRICENL